MVKSKLVYVVNLDQFIQGKRDQTSKFIMLVIEKHMKRILGERYRNTKEFAEIRNTVFDSVNDFYAVVCLAVENYKNGDDNNGEQI